MDVLELYGMGNNNIDTESIKRRAEKNQIGIAVGTSHFLPKTYIAKQDICVLQSPRLNDVLEYYSRVHSTHGKNSCLEGRQPSALSTTYGTVL